MLENLKKLRKIHNISQQQLGEKIGVSQQSVNKYENHNIEPDIATLKSIADFFNTSVDYLIGHSEIDTPSIHLPKEGYTKKELALIENYRKLTENEKESIDLVIKNYLNK